ncbi:MAG: methionine synthase [Alphaproteobacteria bacterium]
MTKLLQSLKEKILIADGGMGALVQDLDLNIDDDFWGKENCTDVLCLSRPDLIQDIHRQYLEAGADLITTNSFGGSSITLQEFDLQDQCFELNKKAAEIARKAIEEYGSDEPKFVMGDIGPGTKLPSLGHIDYDSLEQGMIAQCEGLLAGGVDLFLIETCQDPLQIKAAINAARAAMKKYNKNLPIWVQVSVETNGALLAGSDIAAATTILEAMDVDLIGLNCATGPREMAEHLDYISEYWQGFISVQPNAGLPELVDGRTHYPLSPDELAVWQKNFVQKQGVNVVGGCCGTTPAHIKAIYDILADIRLHPKERKIEFVPHGASLYTANDYLQENSFYSIGERCNSNGSKAFRDMQAAEDWEGCINLAIEQQKEGSNALDLCVAHVDRNEQADMITLMSQLRWSVNIPIVIDSTDTQVIEEALKLYGGKAIINSINLEDGEKDARQRLALAKKFGASVIALTIDEEGMAKDCKTKVAITERLVHLACNEYGLKQSDLFIDPLTFTIATGNKDDYELGLETLNAIKEIHQRWPELQIVLGLSNISFGLKMAARHVLNSVYLHHAIAAGMSAAIVHVSKIMPLHQIKDEEVQLFDDLIFNRRKEGYDPLEIILETFADRKVIDNKPKLDDLPLDERLKQRIVDGNMTGLEEDLQASLDEGLEPLDIINTTLLDGMKVVGELFGSGQMQLPFVLKSAETMKKSVSFLEPLMEKTDAASSKGKLVLATVKGDVHDIGKNLVDIIISNNGFDVINLGIRQDIQDILKAAKEHNADAIGMSGLLVRSAVIMKENLAHMSEEGWEVPVILGGAALTKRFVNEDCSDSYQGGNVFYAGDAFSGLSLMEEIADGRFDERIKKQQNQRARSEKRKLQQPSKEEEDVAPALRPLEYDKLLLQKNQLHQDVPILKPPFWGAKKIENIHLKNLTQYLNLRMLFRFHLGNKNFKAENITREQRDLIEYIGRITSQEKMFSPQAMYGYWPCNSEGNELIVFDPEDHDKELLRIRFPRQNEEDGLAISDFYRDISTKQRDILGLQVVSMGQKAADIEQEWFKTGRYQDYLYAHSFGVEMTEALAEHIHRHIRSDLGIAKHDEVELNKLLNQGYQGARWSFGYPACPNIEEQRKILKLLQSERIGVYMDENLQMHPEQTTAAIVSSHPQARYFAV